MLVILTFILIPPFYINKARIVPVYLFRIKEKRVAVCQKN
ncbi:hypothetical protein B4155_3087 [Bacillus cereus]|nr:hypothetical protein H175_ch3937 [Bacillus thuringiensis serovar thuringiensis str. IS5056]KZD32075.1 hypothetical protein B4081_3054 [Bacillus cereus]KZD72783.1 hypothetical protein B4120_5214 [Bacillus cereus]KZD81140.1 hypothetical protein B4155_3087 [Bacillus cereus]